MVLSDVRKLAFFSAVFTIGISSLAIYHFVTNVGDSHDIRKEHQKQLLKQRHKLYPKSHTTIVEEEDFDSKMKHGYDHKIEELKYKQEQKKKDVDDLHLVQYMDAIRVPMVSGSILSILFSLISFAASFGTGTEEKSKRRYCLLPYIIFHSTLIIAHMVCLFFMLITDGKMFVKHITMSGLMLATYTIFTFCLAYYYAKMKKNAPKRSKIAHVAFQNEFDA